MNPRWGIVGTGGISRTTAGDLHLTENVDLVAVASRTTENAEAFAAEFDVPRAYGSYDELFAAEDVDVVYIGTPIGTHFEVARQALLAGKHVLLEKAFTTSADEARELAALATSQRRFLMEAMWMRFNPAIQQVLAEIAAGAIGDVRTVQAGFGFPPPPDAIHWRQDLGGGSLLDMGVYPLSFAHLVMGVPDSVEATGEMRDDGLDVTASVFLRYGDGRFAHALSSLAGPVDPVASVGGSRGGISLDAPFFFRGSYRVLTFPGLAVRPETVPVEGRGYVPMFRAASEGIGEGLLEHPLRPLADTIAVLETIDEVRRQLTAARDR
jgi:predicted dehydrogenase